MDEESQISASEFREQPVEVAGQEEPASEEMPAIREEIEITEEKKNEKILQGILQEMQAMRQDFEIKVKYDESKERQIDSLHQELQVYRAGFHFKILRPLFVDLIAMHDDLDKLIEGISPAELDPTGARMYENLQSFQATVEDILMRHGVEPYRLEGDTSVPGKQRVIQTIETADPQQDKKIARRVRKGFAYDDRILRPELIITYRASSSLA